MKKRLVSIILTVFLVLSMMPFAAFADNAIICPACGGEVTKKPYHLVGNYWDFYKCNTCGKWAYLSGVAGLKLLSAGDQAIINAADANAILNFAFNNGHLVPATKAPSGVGRKDLPGYCDTGDGTSTPQVDSNGKFVDGWVYVTPEHDYSYIAPGYGGYYAGCEHYTKTITNKLNASFTCSSLPFLAAYSNSSSGFTDGYFGNHFYFYWKVNVPAYSYVRFLSFGQYTFNSVLSGKTTTTKKIIFQFACIKYRVLYGKRNVIFL